MNNGPTCPLVAIAIPVYNGVAANSEKILRNSLDSYVNQDYPNLEIIICDNNSADDTFLIFQEYEERNNFITLGKNNRNIGPIADLQRILKEAKRKYFLFASADDVYHPTYITKCVAELERTGRVACQSYMKTIDVNGENRYYFLPLDANNKNFKNELEEMVFIFNATSAILILFLIMFMLWYYQNMLKKFLNSLVCFISIHFLVLSLHGWVGWRLLRNICMREIISRDMIRNIQVIFLLKTIEIKNLCFYLKSKSH